MASQRQLCTARLGQWAAARAPAEKGFWEYVSWCGLKLDVVMRALAEHPFPQGTLLPLFAVAPRAAAAAAAAAAAVSPWMPSPSAPALSASSLCTVLEADHAACPLQAGDQDGQLFCRKTQPGAAGWEKQLLERARALQAAAEQVRHLYWEISERVCANYIAINAPATASAHQGPSTSKPRACCCVPVRLPARQASKGGHNSCLCLLGCP